MEQKVKYHQQINTMLKDIFYEDWMDEQDWAEFLEEVQSVTGIGFEKLSKDIEEGVKNGYSVETQMKLIKQVLKNNAL